MDKKIYALVDKTDAHNGEVIRSEMMTETTAAANNAKMTPYVCQWVEGIVWVSEEATKVSPFDTECDHCHATNGNHHVGCPGPQAQTIRRCGHY